MVWLVYMEIQGAALFTNGKLGKPSSTYGETFEEDRAEEARAYFWQCVEFGAKSRERMTEGGAGDYSATLATLESEQAEEPQSVLMRITIAPSGTMRIATDGDETEAEALAEKLRKSLRGYAIITEEPTNEGQAEEARRFKFKATPKA